VDFMLWLGDQHPQTAPRSMKSIKSCSSDGSSFNTRSMPNSVARATIAGEGEPVISKTEAGI
jgi:hypothetical protein